MSSKQRIRVGYLFLIPTLVVFLVLIAYPVCSTIYLSFCNYRTQTITQGAVFNGVANYVKMFQDEEMWTSLIFTVKFTVISVVLETVLGMACALIMNRNFRGSNLVCAMVLVPWCIPTVVSGLMWSYMYAESFGIINYLLSVLHVIQDPIKWLTDGNWAFVAVIISDVWKTVPYMSLLLLSGLKTVSNDYLEAAAIDGAGKVRIFFSIVLPNIRPVMMVAVMFRTIQSFRVYDLIKVLTNGGPQGSTKSLTMYAMEQYFNFGNMGYGAALAVLTFVISLIIAAFFQEGVKSKLEV